MTFFRQSRPSSKPFARIVRSYRKALAKSTAGIGLLYRLMVERERQLAARTLLTSPLHVYLVFTGVGHYPGQANQRRVALSLSRLPSHLPPAHFPPSRDSLSTLVDGNEPEGSFYLTYYCESNVKATMANVTQHDNVVSLNDTSARVGDTLRINRLAGSAGGLVTEWDYYTVEVVNGSRVALTSDVSAKTGYYYAEFGDFYSGPGMAFGVSTNCRQADPDFTNNPLDHDVSATVLQDELQGLAQVNSSAGCLEVCVR